MKPLSLQNKIKNILKLTKVTQQLIIFGPKNLIKCNVKRNLVPNSTSYLTQ